MPIKIPSKLPAKKQLEREQVQLISSDTALTQDIRPMKVLLLNLRLFLMQLDRKLKYSNKSIVIKVMKIFSIGLYLYSSIIMS